MTCVCAHTHTHEKNDIVCLGLFTAAACVCPCISLHMRAYILFLFLLTACSAVRATLICGSRAESVLLVQRAAEQDAALRFQFRRGTGAPALSRAALDTLLVEQTHLIVNGAGASAVAARTATVSDDDSRQSTWPAAWLTEALLAYPSTQLEALAAANCTALAAAIAAGTAAPPLEVLVVLGELYKHQTLLAAESQCADNEVALLNEATGDVYCACASGRVCAATTTAQTLGTAVNGLVIALAVFTFVGALVLIVHSTWWPTRGTMSMEMSPVS